MATIAASQPRSDSRLHGLAYHWQVLAVVAVAMFMVVLDTTIVNIALPRIITIFGSSVDQAQLVLTGYMLALAVVMPATAYLAQRFGTKRVFLFTVAMFTLGSMLCGAAWSVPSLVGARVLQGLGGGMVQPLGMAMIFRVTPPERRGSIMGVFALPVMVAPILGPTLGGYLVEYVDWRWVFYLNVPVGALALLLGSTLLRETPTQRGMPFDATGFVLAALATAPALLALQDAPSKGFGDPWVILRLGLAALSLVAFVWWELRTPRPLLNLRLFAIPAFAMGAVLNFVTSTALFGAIFLLPLFLQNLRGLGAMETGLLLFPQALASGVSAVVGGRLYDRIGARPLIVSGLLILATATWLLSRLDLNTPDDTVRWLLVLRGSSMGLAMMPAMTLWLAAAPARDTQAASALSNVLRQVYGAFGTAVFATFLQNRIAFHYAATAMFVTPDRPAVARMLGLGQQFALAHGLDLAQARALTVAQLMGQARLGAAVRGFDDCFLLAAVACVLGIVPALFLRAAPRAAGPGYGPVEV
ncbi:MAG TPA: DHA2 family efflux MFS transporter permease subunit [Chloroflexota bacterium]